MSRIRSIETFEYTDIPCSVVAEDTTDGRVVSAVSINQWTVQVRSFRDDASQVCVGFTGLEEGYFDALRIVERLKNLIDRKVPLAEAARASIKQWNGKRL